MIAPTRANEFAALPPEDAAQLLRKLHGGSAKPELVDRRIFVQNDRDTFGRKLGGSGKIRNDVDGASHGVIEILGLEDEPLVGIGADEKSPGFRVVGRPKQENRADLWHVTVPGNWTMDPGIRSAKLRSIVRVGTKGGGIDRG
jgi:hypothetical protein